MPKNKGGGNKKKKSTMSKRDMVYKDDGQVYGQITKSLGNGYMEVNCFMPNDCALRRGHIRGNMRKRVWMGIGDIVLINIRGYQDDVCDIVIKYTPDEVRLLRNRKLIPDTIDINDTASKEEDNIVFAENDTNNTTDPNLVANPVAQQNRNYAIPESDSESESDEDDAIDTSGKFTYTKINTNVRDLRKL